jgi:hypothetical protein
MFRIVVRLLLALVLAGWFGGIVAAQVSADVSIAASPAKVDIKAKPGSDGSTEITVFNKGNEAFGVTAAIEPYPGADGAFSAVDWLSIDPAQFDLAPGQQQKVTLDIKIPDALKSGGRYARVSFTTSIPGKQSDGAAVGLRGKLRGVVLITIDGNGKLSYKAEIEKFAPVLEPDGRFGFFALVNNTGNIHFIPKGIVDLSTSNGKSYGKIDFGIAPTLIPGVSQTLQSQGTIPLQNGATYVASVEIDHGTKKPLKAKVEFKNEVSVEMTGLSVCENLDRGPTVTAKLVNKGDVGIVPTIALTVMDANGNVAGKIGTPGTAVLWPHDTANPSGDLDQRLVSGDYTLTAQLQYGSEKPLTKEIPFSIAGTGPNVAPLCAPASAATPAS